jgi:alpha-glucoside transport system substrate-binding protein
MCKNINRCLSLSLFMVFAMLLSACGVQPTVQESNPSQASTAQAPAIHEIVTPAPALTETPSEAMLTTTQPPAEIGKIDCMGAKPGDTLSLLYPWSGTQEEMLKVILKPLVDTCGIVLDSESVPNPAMLNQRVEIGTPPDIIFGKVATFIQYQNMLKPLAELGIHAENYVDYWIETGSVDGSWLGLPVKVDPETIMWYSPATFQAFGYQVPTNLGAFQSLIEKMAVDGYTP